MMKTILILLVGLICFSLNNEAQAFVSPVGGALVAPIQFPPTDFNITGVRLSVIYGRYRQVYGVDLGLVGNITDQRFGGVAVSGIFNYTNGESYFFPFQLAGAINMNVGKAYVYGLQLAAVNYNKVESKVMGLQLAPLGNYSAFTKVIGIQAGLINSANEVYGLQIGLVNFAKSLHGIQIGVVNFNSTGLFTARPLLNVGF